MILIHWDKEKEGTKIILLNRSCLSENLAKNKWDELDSWMRKQIYEDTMIASKMTVFVDR